MNQYYDSETDDESDQDYKSDDDIKAKGPCNPDVKKDDSETDDESDQDYKSDDDIKAKGPCNPDVKKDDSETDDESDQDYKSDDDIKAKGPCNPDVKKDIIVPMWETVLDHVNGYKKGLASNTYLVCTIDGVHKPIILCSGHEHAEKLLVSHLENNYNGPMKLTVYINNSPCADCAPSLKSLLERNEHIQLIIHVTHLYNIKRKSCQLRRDALKPENHMDFVSKIVHADTYRGLRDLMSLRGNRCRIEAFTREVWEALLSVMRVSDESRKRVMRAYGLKLENYDRSRQCEDRRIQKDLNHIKLHSDPWRAIKKNEELFNV